MTPLLVGDDLIVGAICLTSRDFRLMFGANQDGCCLSCTRLPLDNHGFAWIPNIYQKLRKIGRTYKGKLGNPFSSENVFNPVIHIPPLG
jgi:hypothetical protein